MDKNEEFTSLRPRSAAESMFTVSPGPMTLVSSFFSENDPDSDCRSFSQLLAGAVESPVTAEESGGDLRFKMNRPSGLAVTQPSMFTIPPGLSPACLLDSPGLFSAANQVHIYYVCVCVCLYIGNGEILVWSI